MQYVGYTINKFRIRFNNLKSRLTNHKKLSVENKIKDDCICKHFNWPDHQGVSIVKFQLIFKCQLISGS